MPSDHEDIYQKITDDHHEKFDHVMGLIDVLRDLYADPAHFIYELLQNAEDEGATEITFSLSDHQLEITHNGELFTEADVIGICSAAASTKEGKIGRFGIGFKSVFAYTTTPQIRSGAKRFQINSYVFPKLLPDSPASEILGDKTSLTLPFNREETSGRAYTDIGEAFEKLPPNAILFLRKIQKARFEVDSRMVRTIERRDEGEDSWGRRVRLIDQADELETTDFLIWPAEGDDSKQDVEVAFAISDESVVPIEEPPLFVFFPTARSTDLPFILQGWFDATPARDNIRKNDKNQGLLRQAADVMVGALQGLKSSERLTAKLLDSLPMKDSEEFGAFPVAARAALASDALLPSLAGSYVSASEIALTTDTVLRDLLSPAQLSDLAPGRQWADPSVHERETPNLWRLLSEELAVPVFDAGHLLSVLDEEFLAQQPSEWIVQLLQYLHGNPAGVTEEAVCTWLAEQLPDQTVERASAPPLLQDDECLRALLRYCKDRDRAKRLAPAPCNDGTIRFEGDEGPRRLTKYVRDLAEGLGGLLTDRAFEEEELIPKWVKVIDGKWLAARLTALADSCTGRSLGDQLPGPLRSIENATDTLERIIKAKAVLTGVPLAVDPSEVVHVFDDQVIAGLPAERARQVAEALLNALGLRPLHKALDLEALHATLAVFTPELVLDRLRLLEGGLSSDVAGLLLGVLAYFEDEEQLSDKHVEALRRLPVWPGSDGSHHRLEGSIYLPPEDSGDPLASRVLTVAPAVCEGSHGDRYRRVLADVLMVEPYDRVTEAIEACTRGPSSREEAVELITVLVKAGPEPRRLEPLQEATFVPCEGGLRKPADAFITKVNLPPQLRSRKAIAAITDNSMAIELLCEQLEAPNLPSAAEIIRLAQQLGESPVVGGREDESVELLKFLKDNSGDYSQNTPALAQLATISWLVPKSGDARRPPSEMIAEDLSYASICWPVCPVGNLQGLSTLLRVKTDLTAEDLARIANEVALRQQPLDDELLDEFLDDLDEAASHGHAVIAELADVAFLPAGRDQSLFKPADFTTGSRSKVWGHLRADLPEQYRERKNLIRLWGIDREEVDRTPAEHLDVLSELAERAPLTGRDLGLAQARIKSIASMSNGAVEARRGDVPVVITDVQPYVEASGDYRLLRPTDEVLRVDLPPDIVRHLRHRLPLANLVDSPIGGFVRAADELARDLGVPSMRDVIELAALYNGSPRNRADWRIRLEEQKVNLIRFLLASSDGMDDRLRKLWPPLVRSVDSLRIQATADDELIVDWPERAFLHDLDSELVLYVEGSEVTADDLAAAIDARFGLYPGTLALLEQILAAPDFAGAAQRLDKNGIAPIPDGEFVPKPRVLPEAEGPTMGRGPASKNEGEGPTDGPNGPDEPEAADDIEERRAPGGGIDDLGAPDGPDSEDLNPGSQPGEAGTSGESASSSSGGTSSSGSGSGGGVSGTTSTGRTHTGGSGGGARGPQGGRDSLTGDRSPTGGAAASPYEKRQQSMADASRRRKRTKEEIERRIASEPDKERRFRITNRTVFEAKDPGVRSFLGNEYDGKCQICHSTFPKHDGEPYFVATLFASFTEQRIASDPGGAWCLCPTCHAKFRHGARQWSCPFREQILNSIGSDEPLTLEVELCGERVKMSFTPNHTVAIQEWTDAVMGLSDEEAGDAV